MITLTDEELVVLDGRCAPDTQKEVDAAKERLAAIASIPALDPKYAAFVADVVREARTRGRLIYRHENLTYCRLCKRAGTYPRYKSGYRRGQVRDRARQIPFGGWELAQRFVTVRGSATLGCCKECFEKVRPELVAALSDVRAEIAKGITGQEPRYRKYANAVCTACGWKGHEGEMIKLRTLMGNGWYPGECPQCHAQNLPLGKAIIEASEHKHGFTVVPAESL